MLCVYSLLLPLLNLAVLCNLQEGQVSVIAGTGPDENRVAYLKNVKHGGPYDPNASQV